MEEKKKRWRPSLGAYRALEKEIEGHMEDKSLLVAECDAWREKYRALYESVSELSGVINDMKALKASLCEGRRMLEESNKALRLEAENLHTSLGRAVTMIEDKDDEIDRLRSRGFWARVFNK